MTAFDAYEIYNENGAAPLVLVCEHASNFMPAQFKGLGLDEALLDYHIAWDPGALKVAKAMADLLDAPLVASKVSRLVYDCNRPPEAADSIVTKAEVHEIPGNRDLTAAARQERADLVYHPFRNALAWVVAQKKASQPKASLVTIHSFVPVFKGVPRTVELGILHDTDSRLADYILDQAPKSLNYVIARNEPYSADDGVTHTLREHAIKNGMANVMIEIRNDLISTDETAKALGTDLAGLIRPTLGQPDDRLGKGS